MRYVLLLQGHRVSALAVGRGECDAPVVFDNSADGRGRFSQYLQERQGTLFTVVLDSKDEEHHLESIPRLRRYDRKLILSKLRQRYFSGDALSVVTAEKSSQRGHEHVPVTISGIGADNDCECWLKLLRNTSTLIVAMCSLPLLGLLIHEALGRAGSICAVQLGHNDFRLMAFNNGRILISRHVSLTDKMPGDLSGELLHQLRNTQSYLSRLVDVAKVENGDATVVTASEPVQQNADAEPLWVIGSLPAGGRELLEDSGVRVSSCRSTAKLLKLRHQLSSPFGDSLFAALSLIGSAREARYSLGVYSKGLKERRVRHLLFAGIFCCFGVTAAATAAAVRVSQSYSALETAVVHMSSKSAMNVVNASLQGNDLKVPVDAIRESMILVRHLDAQADLTPQHFLYYFATDLGDYPELEITAIHWSRVDNDYDKPVAAGIPAFDGRTGEGGTYYSANVTGYIQTNEIERIAALSRFNSFVSRLIESERYASVRVIEAPFGIANGSVTTGGGQFSDQEHFVIALDASDGAKL